jgi:catechol 2,3-dioxygenase-like lactoylglutathione lyase family enzyme
MSGPILDQLNIVVGDMERSVAFYRLLGIEVPDPSPDWPDYHRSAAQPSGVDIDLDTEAFAKTWNGGYRPDGRSGVVIGFRLETREQVDDAYARLTGAGYRGRQVPYDAFWGSRYAVVEDPDGNAVGLMSPRSADLRSAPPELP